MQVGGIDIDADVEDGPVSGCPEATAGFQIVPLARVAAVAVAHQISLGREGKAAIAACPFQSRNPVVVVSTGYVATATRHTLNGYCGHVALRRVAALGPEFALPGNVGWALGWSLGARCLAGDFRGADMERDAGGRRVGTSQSVRGS